MSLAESTPEQEVKKPVDLISPPIGNMAIQGFNGSGFDHSLFSSQFPNQAKLNGYESAITRTPYNAHFMRRDHSGNLVIARQTTADIINLLHGRLETESYLRNTGNEVMERRFSLYVDTPENNFINNVNFVGWEKSKANNPRADKDTTAVFTADRLPASGQFELEQAANFVIIPLSEIVAVLPAYDPDNDLSKQAT